MNSLMEEPSLDVRGRITTFVSGLPVAQRVTMAVAVVALAMGAVVFGRWVMAPTYTVLYSGLDDGAVAQVVGELETLGVPYQLEGGGSRVLVPRDRLYQTRAALASSGVADARSPQGWELLDEQGLTVSNFRQQVDYQRALEGELSRTLSAMDGISQATVHLVLPEEELFAESQKPAGASVLLATTRPLGPAEVEAVTFLVASSVEGLETDQITVADTAGTVLHAPGDAGGTGTVANRQLRQTREFEQALADDIGRLLQGATGSPASVVVRATLNFDETETQTETFDRDSQVTLKEQTTAEQFEGTGTGPGGAVGVDGGQLDSEEQNRYQRDEALREFGVDRTTTRTVSAPGRIERLSVALVIDDGSLSGAEVPATQDVEALVGAGIGLDADRGDTIAVTRVPFPKSETPELAPAGSDMLDRLPQLVGLLVLLVIAVALFLMSRRRVSVTDVQRTPIQVPTQPLGGREGGVLAAGDDHANEAGPAAPELPSQVADLVERQPEEIATLLRGWLADRRGA